MGGVPLQGGGRMMILVFRANPPCFAPPPPPGAFKSLDRDGSGQIRVSLQEVGLGVLPPWDDFWGPLGPFFGVSPDWGVFHRKGWKEVVPQNCPGSAQPSPISL